MRTHWADRPIGAIATLTQDGAGTHVRIPRKYRKSADGKQYLEVERAGDWVDLASFAHSTVFKAGRMLQDLRPSNDLRDAAKKVYGPILIVGGEGTEWMVRESPDSCANLLQKWTVSGMPKAYHRRHEDAILVLFSDMFWPTLLMLEPNGMLSAIALGMFFSDPNRKIPAGVYEAFAMLPARLDWRGESTLDFAALKKGSSARAAEIIAAYFRDQVIKKVEDEFVLQAEMEGPEARFLAAPLFCLGDVDPIVNLKHHENRTQALSLKSGSVDEIVKVMEAAVVLASSSLGHLQDLVSAWLEVAYLERPAKLDYQGPTLHEMERIFSEIVRLMEPRGWSIACIDGNRKSRIVRVATHFPIVVERGELTGHELLEMSWLLKDWLERRAGWSSTDADELIDGLTGAAG